MLNTNLHKFCFVCSRQNVPQVFNQTVSVFTIFKYKAIDLAKLIDNKIAVTTFVMKPI